MRVTDLWFVPLSHPCAEIGAYGKFSALAWTASSQHGVLTKQQLKRDGLNDDQIDYQVKVGRLVRLPGQVFIVAGSADTWKRKAAAASIAAAHHTREEGGAIGAASHRTAARLFGFRSVDEDIDVTVVYPRKLKLPDVRVVRSRDLVIDDLTWVDGIPTTTPERNLVDLGLIFPEPEVMRILRHAVATGLINRREVLRLRLRTSKQGRDGTGVVGHCLEALPDSVEETESGIEALFLELCEKGELPVPVLQLPVIANGRSYRVDFAYPAHKVFVEIDGAGHALPHQISKDGGRQNDLVAHGWQPVRFDYEGLKREPEYCADILRQVLSSVTLGPEIVRPEGHRNWTRVL